MDTADPDLMLVPQESWYWYKLAEIANKRKNVRFIPLLPMLETIRFTSRYDIGMFSCEPAIFNLAYALPNKPFESIQAKLVVAIDPSIEMKKIAEKYDCGVVTAIRSEIDGRGLESTH